MDSRLSRPAAILRSIIREMTKITDDEIAEAQKELAEVRDGEKIVGVLNKWEIRCLALICVMKGFAQRADALAENGAVNYYANLQADEEYIRLLTALLYRAIRQRLDLYEKKFESIRPIAIRKGWQVVFLPKK